MTRLAFKGAHLANNALVRRDVWVQPVEVAVQGEVAEGFPRRLVAVNINGVMVSRSGDGGGVDYVVMPHRWRRHHRYPVHRAVPEFPHFL